MADEYLVRSALDAVRGLQTNLRSSLPNKGLEGSKSRGQDAAPSVFVSWAHAHTGWTRKQTQLWQESVATLASSLRQAFGIDADVDLFHLDESIDWTRYGQRAIVNSDRVVIILSKAWSERWDGTNAPTEGAGAAREADALHGLYGRNQADWQAKLIIAILPDIDDDAIPPDLERVARVRIDPSSLDTYEDLLRNPTDQPRYRKASLGSVPDLPPLNPARNLATLRGQLADIRRQERQARGDSSPEGRSRKAELEVRESAVLGFIEATEQSEVCPLHRRLERCDVTQYVARKNCAGLGGTPISLGRRGNDDARRPTPNASRTRGRSLSRTTAREQHRRTDQTATYGNQERFSRGRRERCASPRSLVWRRASRRACRPHALPRVACCRATHPR